jgi:hypothetical protein
MLSCSKVLLENILFPLSQGTTQKVGRLCRLCLPIHCRPPPLKETVFLKCPFLKEHKKSSLQKVLRLN